MSKKDEYVAEMKQELAELNSKAAELENKIENQGSDVKAKFQEKLNEMHQIRRDAEEKLNEITAAGVEKWEELKGQVEHTRKAFRNSVNYFLSHYK